MVIIIIIAAAIAMYYLKFIIVCLPTIGFGIIAVI